MGAGARRGCHARTWLATQSELWSVQVGLRRVFCGRGCKDNEFVLTGGDGRSWHRPGAAARHGAPGCWRRRGSGWIAGCEAGATGRSRPAMARRRPGWRFRAAFRQSKGRLRQANRPQKTGVSNSDHMPKMTKPGSCSLPLSFHWIILGVCMSKVA